MMPDLVGVSLQSLLTRVAKLEAVNDGPQTGRVIRPPEAGVWHGEDFSIRQRAVGRRWPSGALQGAFTRFVKIGVTVT